MVSIASFSRDFSLFNLNNPQSFVEIELRKSGMTDVAINWVLNTLVQAGALREEEGATMSLALDTLNLSNFNELEIAGFVLDEHCTKSTVLSLFAAMMPARRGCQLYGNSDQVKSCLNYYTDDQLNEAGIWSLANVFIHGGEDAVQAITLEHIEGQCLPINIQKLYDYINEVLT